MLFHLMVKKVLDKKCFFSYGFYDGHSAGCSVPNLYLPMMPSKLLTLLLANEAISECRLVWLQWEIAVASLSRNCRGFVADMSRVSRICIGRL
eukprot:103434-Amphidinium_carterae.1